MQSICVTGGAGYIGSAIVKALISEGYNVVVLDNLSKGKRKLVDKKAEFYEVDLTDEERLDKIFDKHEIGVVMHFAAYKDAGESMVNPQKYNKNIIGTENILKLMVKYNIKKIIYSSSAAVYGNPDYSPIDENHPTKPTNYYGITKLRSEEIIKEYEEKYGTSYVCLRYFNVVGDSGIGYIDPDAKNILPIIMEVLVKKRDKFIIYGNDYNTEDGTCIRDYVDIKDIVDAHIKSLNLNTSEIINLGTSKGISVKELIDEIQKITNKKLNLEVGAKREGDSTVSTASYQKAKKMLDWTPKRDIKEMIKSTYNSYLKNVTN